MRATHKGVLDAHRGVVGFGRRDDVKVADEGGNDNTNHEVSKALSAA